MRSALLRDRKRGALLPGSKIAQARESWRSPRKLALPLSVTRLPMEMEGHALRATDARLPSATRSPGFGIRGSRVTHMFSSTTYPL